MIGQAVPPFQLSAVRYNSSEVLTQSLDVFVGRWLILLFYPRDFSFVCPTELTAFSAQFEEFQSRNCDILGISVDSLDSHRSWFETPASQGGVGALRFPLATDPNGEFARECGLWLEEKQCSARGLLIVDPQGVVQYLVAQNTSVGRNSEEVLRVLDAVQSGGLCPESWTAADGTLDVESELRPGRVVGRYRLLSQLGSGGFGNVFLADDLTLKRKVALKVIRAKASDAREQILEEARAAARINHPNVCTVFAVETIDGLPMIVMEYVEGDALGNLPLDELAGVTRRQIAKEIALGLTDAHAHGVVHGDLKPANVIVTPDHRAKLLDFGLSRRTTFKPSNTNVQQDAPSSDSDATLLVNFVTEHSQAAVPSLSGTPRYMSPEQAQGLPASMASDVFALGLILFELAVGRPAVPKLTVLETLELIRSGKARELVLSNIPEGLAALLGKMLNAAPDDRPVMSDVVLALSDTAELNWETPA